MFKRGCYEQANELHSFGRTQQFSQLGNKKQEQEFELEMTSESACSSVSRPNTHTPALELLAGALAGGSARCIVSPLDVIKIRSQVSYFLLLLWFALLFYVLALICCPLLFSSGSERHTALQYRGIWHMIQTMSREEGIRVSGS